MTKLTDNVQKPYRYFGGEYGLPNVNKPHDVSVCLCVADSYEVGMSNLGVRILYYLFNSLDGVVCERCFAPFADYEKYLDEHGQKLSSLESQTPLCNFDFVGFSIQYEMAYTNVLYMLEKGGIELFAKDRKDGDPFVIVGGPCAVNPEPIYKFADMFFVGEGETVEQQLFDDYRAFRGKSRDEFLRYVDEHYDCIYVPSLHDECVYNGDKPVTLPQKTVKRNIVADLNDVFVPKTQLVSNVELVHDRAVAELFRGCANGCRFCQAGFIYRPVRERNLDGAFDLCRALIENTGYDELSLNSLSTSDYSQLLPLLDKLLPYAESKRVQLNLPSLRLDSFKGKMVEGNRKSSLTFAPEAGTQRLRDVINKNITEENIFESLRDAFKQGYTSVKLYFMMGLPTETMEDIEGIFNLAVKVKQLYKFVMKTGKDLRVSVSCATFIPKPFTPFQWCKFASREEIEQKQRFLVEKFRKTGIKFDYNDYDSSLMEAVLARGGRSIADVVYDAYKSGARFDAWSDHFDFSHYQKAFEKHQTVLDDVFGEKQLGDVLPWDFVNVGVDKEFLESEYKRALEGSATESCNKKCNACGLHKLGFCKTSHGNIKY